MNSDINRLNKRRNDSNTSLFLYIRTYSYSIHRFRIFMYTCSWFFSIKCSVPIYIIIHGTYHWWFVVASIYTIPIARFLRKWLTDSAWESTRERFHIWSNRCYKAARFLQRDELEKHKASVKTWKKPISHWTINPFRYWISLSE